MRGRAGRRGARCGAARPALAGALSIRVLPPTCANPAPPPPSPPPGLKQVQVESEEVTKALAGVREQMQELKTVLYAKFGSSINLEE